MATQTALTIGSLFVGNKYYQVTAQSLERPKPKENERNRIEDAVRYFCNYMGEETNEDKIREYTGIISQSWYRGPISLASDDQKLPVAELLSHTVDHLTEGISGETLYSKSDAMWRLLFEMTNKPRIIEYNSTVAVAFGPSATAVLNDKVRHYATGWLLEECLTPLPEMVRTHTIHGAAAMVELFSKTYDPADITATLKGMHDRRNR